MTRPTLPLGIDFGERRIRVALCERDPAGRANLIAVAARERGDAPADALGDAVRELATRERRCVIGIGHPDALLRALALPPMSRFERARSATFQAARFIDYPVGEAAISLRPGDAPQRWTLGIARRTALRARIDAAKRARLVPLAIDDVAFALARVHDDADATIDVAAETTRLTAFARPLPFVAGVPLGGCSLTAGIARSLGIDEDAAEERKRTIGFGGAGEVERDRLIDEIVAMLAAARAAGCTEIRRIVTIGNGSRIPGFAQAIERATGCGVRPAALAAGASQTLPPDVLRAAGADWSIAYGLSLWSAA
jgi:Tfp pilus assembly PilM family ATPase